MHTISVIVPVYMVGDYIERFLQSLDNQTFKDFEVIFVYDRSDDDSFAKLISYQFKNINLQTDVKIVENKEKRGVGFAKDYGFSFSDKTSKYVIFLDSDDYLDKNFLEKLFLKAEENESDITCCGFLRIDERTGRVLCEEMVHNPEKRVYINDLHFPLFFINTSAWNKLYKRSVANNCSFGLAKHAEDLNYLLQAVSASKTFAFVSEPLYFYMIHEGSLINSLSYSKFTDTCLFFKTFATHDKNDSMSDLISAFIFLRIGIGTTLRVCQDKKNNRKLVLKQNRLYLKENFNVFGKNRYLKFSFLLKAGKKGLAIWVLKNMIRLRMFGLAVRFYIRRVNSGKKEIRW